MTDLRAYIETWSMPIPFVGCWMWLRSLIEQGYGQFQLDGRHRLAHRASYEAFVGPIPSGMLIQHNCDNRWCVNPEHLTLGTDATNNRDALLKGRKATKLKPADVIAIRARMRSGASQRGLAKEYGVSATSIRNVDRGETWTHVNDPSTTDTSTENQS